MAPHFHSFVFVDFTPFQILIVYPTAKPVQNLQMSSLGWDIAVKSKQNI